MSTKRQLLNYRQVGESPGCEECEHRKKLECPVLNGPVYYGMRCDAWNDKSTENTWNFLLYKIKETVCVLIKEEKTTIAREEFPLTENIDKEVTKILEKPTKILGCPDFVTNLSPRKYKSMEFKSWLEYRGIQYRELDVEIDKMEFKVDEDTPPLEVLSIMIDMALAGQKKEE